MAPVSIDNSEWIFASAYEKAGLQKNSTLQKKIAAAYLVYMDQMFAYYEQQSDALFGYQIKQILLIHANVLNSEYLGHLIKNIQARGYRFVSLDRALKDRAYSSKDTYTGPAGITWIETGTQHIISGPVIPTAEIRVHPTETIHIPIII